MKQRFTSLLLARIRQLICGSPKPPSAEIPGPEEDAFSLDPEAMVRCIHDDLAALEAQLEEADKAMQEADAVMQEMFDECNDPSLSEESRALLMKLIETSIRQLTDIRVQAMEDLENPLQELAADEFLPPGDLPEREAASQRRPTKRLFFSTPDHSSASSSPSEQRADCTRGS